MNSSLTGDSSFLVRHLAFGQREKIFQAPWGTQALRTGPAGSGRALRRPGSRCPQGLRHYSAVGT